MASKIEDYALIGDCHTAALIGNDGSIDWLCFPRFDSGACFAALLGSDENGRWLLRPAEDVRRMERRYRDGTLVLETDYETENGVIFVHPRALPPPLMAPPEGVDIKDPVQKATFDRLRKMTEDFLAAQSKRPAQSPE